MKQPNDQAITLVLRHIGERLTMRRIKTDEGIEELRLTGSLPAHQQGPPLHIHVGEDKYVEVVSGTLSALVDGKRLVIKAGDSGHFPKGSVHRWWNDGDEELELRGVVTPAVDLDRYLQRCSRCLTQAGQIGRQYFIWRMSPIVIGRRSRCSPFRVRCSKYYFRWSCCWGQCLANIEELRGRDAQADAQVHL